MDFITILSLVRNLIDCLYLELLNKILLNTYIWIITYFITLRII